jgi:hypothetical protein
MNKQSNRKSTWALGLSIVAIVLCLLVLVLWAFDTYPRSVVTAETFIGACVTLLGVIVTVAVGWQIYNAIEMRQMMRQVEEKQKNIDEAQRKLEGEVRKNHEHSMHLHHMTLAMQQEAAHRYAPAVFYYFGALYVGMGLNMPYDNNDYVWVHVKSCLAQLIEETKIPAQMYKDMEEVDKLIRASENYHWIRTLYEPLYAEYKSKISAAQ